MTLQALALSAEVQAAALALLHFVWQGGVIAALLWLVLALLPSASAAWRYLAACLALVLLALCPLLTFGYLLAQAAPAEPPLLLAAELPAAQAGYLSLGLLAAWALGSAGMTLRLLLAMAALRRLVASAVPASEHWQWQLCRLARQLGLRQRVRLMLSQHVDAPVVLGWLRPVILLPLAALTALPPDHLRALLAHELGHVRRLDYLVNVLQSSVEALLFYHPAVHWVSRCIRVEREHCCDDIAVQLTGEPLRYARALAEMEMLRARLPEPALAANGGTLMNRIERILKPRAPEQAQPRTLLTAGCVLASALGLALAGAWACSSAADSAEPQPTAEQTELTAQQELTAEQAEGSAEQSQQAPALAVSWLPAQLRPHAAALQEAAQRHGVDPALVAIVTLVESMGDPRAESPRGARGLMQLMPATAAHIAAERQLPEHSSERLFEPEYNLDLGAWFLSRLLDTYGSAGGGQRTVELAAVAYNGGRRVAQAYLEQNATLPAETARYRDLVVALWNERLQPESPTFSAWQQRLGAAPR